ncbi:MULTISPECIES: TetR/AcrR family transcriptional regulator [unclassified Fusibacter]|uniref:TetR/AcrR family transcriptional regulator n=1 Tax=unclassified Fusibacter TaxID=2624464 RepID=UPI001010E2B2|nr:MULTISPECIES: TetR/AcrR family transcriptional regulator [unclassified Fusibacter]MCK8058576.1 TetR/AcrR family transcriptional regulator [Fusibacter sp. A2]NPE22654.1 TetR/AcrR family transcriptional regulator [Fusibacter sp. A1]RXV60217.1 TetR/AcrR family transcriptional regulator [Fusibacter sp. A1]
MTTKDKICRVSLKYFITQGYEYTSLEQIANEVGIKKPSIYYHYKSKEDLLAHGVHLIIDEVLSTINRHVIDHDPCKVQLQGFFESILDCNQNLSALIGSDLNGSTNISAIFQLSANRFDHIAEEITAYYDSLIAIIINILNRGVNLGEIELALEVEKAAIEILATIEGLITISSLYKKLNIAQIRTTLYDRLWDTISITPIKEKKKTNKVLDSFLIGRKW